jgi:hypothetical protein
MNEVPLYMQRYATFMLGVTDHVFGWLHRYRLLRSSGRHFRAKRGQLERLQGLLLESQGQNLA